MFIKKNLNPKGENIGDCVIRAFTAILAGGEVNEEVYLSVLKGLKRESRRVYGHEKNYRKDRAIISLAKQLNMTIVKCEDSWSEWLFNKYYFGEDITTIPRGTVKKFAKFFNKKCIAITCNHAVYLDGEGNYMDTWDSGMRRPKYLLFA